MQYLVPTHTKKLFIVYLEFKLNVVPYILFGKSTRIRSLVGHHVAEGRTPLTLWEYSGKSS